MPSYVSAGASAAALSLAVAIQDAFKLCTFPTAAAGGLPGADSLLFDPALIACLTEEDKPYTGTLYNLIMAQLSSQKLSTFFGEHCTNVHNFWHVGNTFSNFK
jgi:hypothetical protein